MNTKNLILTSTNGMSREDWLAFRKPMTHVMRFIAEEVSAEDRNYEGLKEFFASETWKEFVFPCVGGSEVGYVLGLSPYKSIIELYFEKIGLKPTNDEDNVAMFWGRELEEQIAQKWQYWDGEPETMIVNFANGNLIRKCRRLNAYVQNKNFPFLFVSLDRLINKMKKGKETSEEGVLECKTISGFAANQWESGFPPSYVVQIQSQLAVTELPFGESGILRDGRHMEVLPFDYNEGIANNVKIKCASFMQLVKRGIEQVILAQNAPAELREQHLHEAERIAPEPDGSVAYEDFLKGKHSDKGLGRIAGGDHEFEIAVKYSEASKKVEEAETEKRLHSNWLKKFIGDHNGIDFGSRGYVGYAANKNGVRSFRLGIKA